LATEIGKTMKISEENIYLLSIGSVLELNENSAKLGESVPAGRVLVDGLGVGDVGNIVLRDRKHLAEDGLIVIVVTISGETGQVLAGPDVISRGFVYVRESENLIEGIRETAKSCLDEFERNNIRDWTTIKTKLKSKVSEELYRDTKRKPMILPVIMEI